MSDRVRLSIWSGPRFLPGTKLVRFLPPGIEAPWEESVQAASDRLSFMVPSDGVFVPALSPGTIVQQEFRGEIREWIVETRNRRWASEANAVTITCMPIHHLLRLAPIERRPEGGIPESAVAAVNLSPREMIGTFVVPQMAYWGLDIFRTGLVQVSTRDTLAMTGWTPMQVLDWMAERFEAAWNLRADESAQVYRIDFGEDLRGDEPIQITLREGRQLSDFEIEDSADDLHTAVMVRGDIPEGGDQPATIADAVFRVTSVEPDGGDDLIHVTLPGGGSPIIEDGQHVGLRLMAADLSTEEIIGTTAPGTFRVANGAAFAEGDLIQMVATEDRDGITYLVSPSGVQQSGLPVPVLGVYDMEGRGERQWAPNAYFNDPPEPPFEPQVPVIARVKTGGSVLTSIELQNLPPDTEFPAGTVFWRRAGTNLPTRTITNAPATSDSSGEMTISIIGSLTVVAGETMHVFVGSSRFGNPFNVDGDQAGFRGVLAHATPMLSRPPGSMMLEDLTGVDVTGVIDTLGPDYGKIVVEGLPPGAELWPGDSISASSPTAPHYGPVLEYAVADGSGVALVKTFGVVTLVNNGNTATNRTLFRPDGSAMGAAGRVVVLPILTSANELKVRTVGTPVPGRLPVVVGIMGILVHRRPEVAGEYVWGRPRVEARRTSDNAVLGFAETDGTTIPADTRTLPITLRVPVPISGDSSIYLRLETRNMASYSWAFLRHLGIQSGPDVNAPETGSSHANRLFAEAQRRLRRHRFGLRKYRARVSDLARSWDLPTATVARLRPGSRVVVDVPTANQKLILRVERINRAEDPRDTQVEFETLPGRFTRSVRAGGGEALGFVDVRFTEGVDRQTLLVRSRPPTAGLPSASNPSVDDGDDPWADDPEPPEVPLPIGVPG